MRPGLTIREPCLFGSRSSSHMPPFETLNNRYGPCGVCGPLMSLQLSAAITILPTAAFASSRFIFVRWLVIRRLQNYPAQATASPSPGLQCSAMKATEMPQEKGRLARSIRSCADLSAWTPDEERSGPAEVRPSFPPPTGSPDNALNHARTAPRRSSKPNKASMASAGGACCWDRSFVTALP